jgi:hypothetical protein
MYNGHMGLSQTHPLRCSFTAFLVLIPALMLLLFAAAAVLLLLLLLSPLPLFRQVT